MADGRHLEKLKNVVLMDIINSSLKTGNKTANINVKNCSLYTLLMAKYRKQQKPQKGNVNHIEIDIQAMLVLLTLPFYDFCCFRFVTINSVYKLQFFLHLYEKCLACHIYHKNSNVIHTLV